MWRFIASVFLTILLGFVFLGALTGGAQGAGGQVQVGNPIFGVDCVGEVPEGLTAEDCEYVSSDESGLQHLFLCGDIEVTCDATEGGDPGQIQKKPEGQ